MTIVLKDGDLFTSDATVIAHGVNCMAAMKSGIALQFVGRFPEMHEYYNEECSSGNFNPGNVLMWPEPGGLIIANIASQKYPGANARYSWTIEGLKKVVQWCEKEQRSKIALPRIGCGVGSLDWDVMYKELDSNFGESEIILEVWSL